jgi:hypothetical protein
MRSSRRGRKDFGRGLDGRRARADNRIVKKLVLSTVVLLVLGAAGADAAKLPGVKTPTRNISCFWVPIKKTAGAPITAATRGNLLCDIKQAAYLKAEQDGCQARVGLDWHGFELSSLDRRAAPACSGGILYDIGRDTPTFQVLAYGRTWRFRGFTCTSRFTGLTCTNRYGHGLFLSRESRRLW